MDIAALHGAQASIPVAPVSLPPELAANKRELIQAVKSLNAIEKFGPDNELTYQFDRETHRAVMRVVDRKTRQVVVQIPPQRVLEMAQEQDAG
jgi:flagellar protein FlaG